MLNIILPIMSLLILPTVTKKYWHIITSSLIIITPIPFITSPHSSMMNMTSLSAMDSMSSILITLSVWVTALMFMASYKILNSNKYPKNFSITCIILLSTLILCFSASSLFSFYIWFESSLIPTMLLIMMWGYQQERTQASMYLMIYTVTASLPLLLMLMKIYTSTKHLNMTMQIDLFSCSKLMWMMMITAFLVKLPIYSVHLWLPKAHVEAPVAGSMILAAILLKLGSYGLARIMYLFPHMNALSSPFLISLALIGGVLTSLICMRQTDMKSLIAYSSIGHMGLMVAGMFSCTKMGLQASLAMMIAHGLSSSAMFSMANITYEMTNTRSLMITKGLMSSIPLMSLMWFISCCANMAAPPSINLMSEILLITSITSQSYISMLPVALISFLTVAYSLLLYSTINHGSPNITQNPSKLMDSPSTLLMTMHIIPIIFIICKPEMITSWC